MPRQISEPSRVLQDYESRREAAASSRCCQTLMPPMVWLAGRSVGDRGDRRAADRADDKAAGPDLPRGNTTTHSLVDSAVMKIPPQDFPDSNLVLMRTRREGVFLAIPVELAR